MAITTWNGSMTSNLVLADKPAVEMLAIEQALDRANATQITTPREDLALLGLMTKTVEGKAGAYQAVSSFAGYFHDNTDYMDAEEFHEEYNEWRFGRRDYAVKNGSYGARAYKSAIEDGVNIDANIAKKTIELLATYENIFKPYIVFETLLTVPADGGGADFPYEKEFGAIRNRAVDKRKLKSPNLTASAGAMGGLVRNNWRTIASSAGVNRADTDFCTKYITEPVGIFKSNVVLFGDSSDLSEIQLNVFSDFSPTTEQILVGGIPTGIQVNSFNGLKMVSITTALPEKVVAFINTGADDIITKLESSTAEFKGVAVEFPRKGEKFVANAEAFDGAKIVIQEVGYHMTGVLDVLFLDIDTDNAETNRLMNADSIAKVEQKAKDLKAMYYVPLNKRK